jgi:hypothetical protein
MSHEEQATFIEQVVQEISRRQGESLPHEMAEEIRNPSE